MEKFVSEERKISMNIIVTGGAGFIGSNFVFYMLNKYPNYRIICLDKLTYAGNLSTLAPVMENPNFRFVKADICDREKVYQLFEEEHPDIVVNFAAESHVDRSIEDPSIFLQTNIIGTATLMDACRKYGIPFIPITVYTSSHQCFEGVLNVGKKIIKAMNGFDFVANPFQAAEG